MNSWTAVLESLHSALIDELTERCPEPRPGLGMPLRRAVLDLPNPAITELIGLEIEVDASRGVGLLAVDAKALNTLQMKTATELWSALAHRAGSEFSHRGIRPRFGSLTPIPVSNPACPAGWSSPNRVIWIPVSLVPGLVYLGLGV